MSPIDARNTLRDLGWTPGMSTAEHPKRDQIKLCLNALRDAGLDPAAADPAGDRRRGKTSAEQ